MAKDKEETKVTEEVESDEDFDVTKDEGKVRLDEKGLKYRAIKKRGNVTMVYR